MEARQRTSKSIDPKRVGDARDIVERAQRAALLGKHDEARTLINQAITQLQKLKETS